LPGFSAACRRQEACRRRESGRAGLIEMARRTFLQLHLGAEPEDGADTREFISLPHPRTGQLVRYMLRGERVFELQVAKPPEDRGSWFVDNVVKQDGSVQLISEVDVIFLVVPLLAGAAAKRFVPLNDIWDSSAHRLNYRKLSKCDLSAVRFVCDAKEAGGDSYYRFSESRMLTWMMAKVDRLVAQRQLSTDDAVGLVSQYADKRFETQLEELYGLGAKVPSKRKSLDGVAQCGPDATVQPAPFVSPPQIVKPAQQAGGGPDMFTPRLLTEKETAQAPQAKKLRIDKIDKRGMNKLTSFFKVKKP
jgi:hypothetical protein